VIAVERVDAFVPEFAASLSLIRYDNPEDKLDDGKVVYARTCRWSQ
jgi:hypothetical protein